MTPKPCRFNSLIGNNLVRCDGACGKKHLYRDMAEFGRCEHVICSRCIETMPHFDQVLGTIACPCNFVERGADGRLSTEVSDDPELFNRYFLGAMKERSLRKHLEPNQFRLFYKMPRSRREIAISLPLKLGYMSSRGKAYYFSITCGNPRTAHQTWHVDSGNKKILAFETLSSLIRYYAARNNSFPAGDVNNVSSASE